MKGAKDRTLKKQNQRIFADEIEKNVTTQVVLPDFLPRRLEEAKTRRFFFIFPSCRRAFVFFVV